MSVWKIQFLLRPWYCNLGLKVDWCNIDFYTIIFSDCLTMQVNASIAVMNMKQVPDFGQLFHSALLFFFLSFTSCSGQRLCLRKGTALTSILGFARYSSLTSLSILASNRYMFQIEWVGSEVTAGINVYGRHVLLFLANLQSNSHFILTPFPYVCVLVRGENTGLEVSSLNNHLATWVRDWGLIHHVHLPGTLDFEGSQRLQDILISFDQ